MNFLVRWNVAWPLPRLLHSRCHFPHGLFQPLPVSLWGHDPDRIVEVLGVVEVAARADLAGKVVEIATDAFSSDPLRRGNGERLRLLGCQITCRPLWRP